MAELMGDERHESAAVGPKEPEEDDAEEDPIERSRMIVEATSLGHLTTHRTTNPHCPSCQRAKFAHKPARRRDKKPEVVPVKFGDLVTADHMITLADQDRGNHGESTAVVVLDRATGFIGVYPLGSNTVEGAMEALQHFASGTKVQRFYRDNSGELIKAAKVLQWPHDTSTPGRPATNGVAERNVRRVVEGCRTLLVQSGLGLHWWPHVARHFSIAWNTEDVGEGSP